MLAGAYISDHFLGKLYTIAYLSCVYCLGHLILALWESTTGVVTSTSVSICNLYNMALDAHAMLPLLNV